MLAQNLRRRGNRTFAASRQRSENATLKTAKSGKSEKQYDVQFGKPTGSLESGGYWAQYPRAQKSHTTSGLRAFTKVWGLLASTLRPSLYFADFKL